MKYLSVVEASKKWDVSERSVRKYCSEGRVEGAFLTGKTWNIPEISEKPIRKNRTQTKPVTLLDILKLEKKQRITGGIYHKLQIELTYNSNHIERSRLTHDQTRYIYETNTIGIENEVINVDDIVETANHFKCIDMIIDSANSKLSEEYKVYLACGSADMRKSINGLCDIVQNHFSLDPTSKIIFAFCNKN